MVMDIIVKDLDSNYRLDAFRNKAEKIIVEKWIPLDPDWNQV